MYRIAVIGGDGIGPEVVQEGLKVLEAAATRTGVKYELEHYDLGGDRYLRTGEELPDSVLEELRGFDAIFLGAVGHPEVAPGILEKNLLLRIRFELDQYINLRPVKLYPGADTQLANTGPADADLVVLAEDAEGLPRRRGERDRDTGRGPWRPTAGDGARRATKGTDEVDFVVSHENTEGR